MNTILPSDNSLKIHRVKSDAPAPYNVDASMTRHLLTIPSAEAVQKKINAVALNTDEIAFLNKLRCIESEQLGKDLLSSHLDLFMSSPHLANVTIFEGRTPFFYAVLWQKWDLIKLMLEHCPHIDINAGPITGPYEGVTAFLYAANWQQWDIVQLILQHYPHADINATCHIGANREKTPLWLAANAKQWPIVRLMLKCSSSANINVTPLEGNNRGATPLFYAVSEQQWDVVELMLKRPVNVDASPIEGPHRGKTPLWIAAGWKQWPIVRRMLQCHPHANFNATPLEGAHRGKTPFWQAVSWQQWDIAEIMLKGCVDINVSPKEGLNKGETALWYTTVMQQWDVTKLLLEYPVDVNAGPVDDARIGQTPLWFATYYRQWDIVKRMLQCDPQANVSISPLHGNHRGETPLWNAVVKQQWAIVKLMLKSSSHIDVDAAPLDSEGLTPLCGAALMQQWDIVKSMLICHPRACLELFGQEVKHLFYLKNVRRIANFQDEIASGTVLELALISKDKAAIEVSAACIFMGVFFEKFQPQPIKALRHKIEYALNQIYQSYQQHLNFSQQNFFLPHMDSIAKDLQPTLVDEFRRNCPGIAFLPDSLLLEQMARYCHIKQIVDDQDNLLHTFFNTCANGNFGPLRLLRLIEEGTIFHYAAHEGDQVAFDELFSQLQNTDKADCLLKRSHIANKTVLGSLKGKTPLHFAAIKGHAKIATQLAALCPRLLVERDDQNQTAGVLANRYNHKALAIDLVKASLAVKGELPVRPPIVELPILPLIASPSKENPLQPGAFEKPFPLTRSKKKVEKLRPLLEQNRIEEQNPKITPLKTIPAFVRPVPILLPAAVNNSVAFECMAENCQIPAESHAPSALKAEARKNALEWEERQNRKNALKKSRKVVLSDSKPYQEDIVSRCMPQAEVIAAPSLNYKRLQKRVSEANLKKSVRLTEQLITSTLESLQAEGLIDYRQEGNTISANKVGEYTTCLTIHTHSTAEFWYRKPEVVKDFLAFVQACGLDMFG